MDQHGDPQPWTPETLEAACDSAGKPVDKRTIQNWRSGKNKPGRRNMHVLAKVASGGDERQRQAWADQFIATLDTPAAETQTDASPQIIAPSPDSPEPLRANTKTPPNRKLIPALIGGALSAALIVFLLRPALGPQ